MDRASVTQLLGEYGWLVLMGFAVLLFKSTLERAVEGFMVHFGRDYDVDDVVLLNGRPGRITRVGLWKTVFFLYIIRDGKILGGTKAAITNDKLKDMLIEKPLQIFDIKSLGIDNVTELEKEVACTKNTEQPKK